MNQALMTGDDELMDILVKSGHLNGFSERDELGNSPIFLSVLYDRPEMLRWLVEKGFSFQNFMTMWIFSYI